MKALVRGSVLKTGRKLVVSQATAYMVNDIMVEDPEPCACMVGAISAVDWIPDLDAMSRSGRP